ncbi:hypothetical protein GCM10017044_24050 [Kordiimonas sediminis]|uniref:Peptidase S33 tripeptidyl aminopeptidase-like C-terminal domain-containing protein n=1 Tax=Kordiimonas sediminis TaxID=1735581 RepID=A0A919AVI1_9PROT|nr:hypothetical protein GCM10017044_24050 [Kordiimonas sediminis]
MQKFSPDVEASNIVTCASALTLSKDWLEDVSPLKHAQAIKTVRQDIGIAQWDIISESFGLHVFWALKKIDAAAISAVIFDSPDTPWVPSYFHFGQHLDKAFGEFAEGCRKDWLCPARRQNLKEEIYTWLAPDRYEPDAIIDVVDVKSGAVDGYVLPSSEQVAGRLVQSLMTVRNPNRLPYIFSAHSREQFQDRLGLLFLRYGRESQNLVSFAGYHGGRCSVLPLSNWYSALLKDAAQFPALRPFLKYISETQKVACQSLGIEAPTQFAKPEGLDTIKAFIIGGALDPVTPMSVIREAFSSAAQVDYNVYDNVGHVVSSAQPCIVEDMKAYLDDGQAPLPSHCRGRDLKLYYFTPVVVR